MARLLTLAAAAAAAVLSGDSAWGTPPLGMRSLNGVDTPLCAAPRANADDSAATRSIEDLASSTRSCSSRTLAEAYQLLRSGRGLRTVVLHGRRALPARWVAVSRSFL